MFQSTKTYGHEQGLSCAFRQWRAQSHCNKLHGYALAFRFVFQATELDDKGWVVDFGGLKGLKEDLKETFDHVTAVAGDDPCLPDFLALRDKGMANVLVFPSGVGVEKFAQKAWWMAWQHIQDMNRAEGRLKNRLSVVSCECMEHSGNSAIYIGEDPDLHK